jgi:hypothetical protein
MFMFMFMFMFRISATVSQDNDHHNVDDDGHLHDSDISSTRGMNALGFDGVFPFSDEDEDGKVHLFSFFLFSLDILP